MGLVDHVFSRFIQQGIIKEDTLDMMERFGVIAKFSPSPADVKYFVPAQLKSPPESICKMELSPTDFARCISTLCIGLYLMVSSNCLSHGPFVGVVRLGPWSIPHCTKMEHGLLLESKFTSLFSFARQDSSRLS